MHSKPEPMPLDELLKEYEDELLEKAREENEKKFDELAKEVKTNLRIVQNFRESNA